MLKLDFRPFEYIQVGVFSKAALFGPKKDTSGYAAEVDVALGKAVPGSSWMAELFIGVGCFLAELSHASLPPDGPSGLADRSQMGIVPCRGILCKAVSQLAEEVGTDTFHPGPGPRRA